MKDLRGAWSIAAEEYASGVLGCRVPPGSLPAAFEASIQRSLSRGEEVTGPRDQWGNWEGPDKKPGTAFYRASLDREVIDWAGTAGLSRSSLWPNGSKWVFCLSHDMDFVCRYARWREVFQRTGRFFKAGGLANTVRRCGGGLLRSMGGLGGDPWWCYEKWLEIAREADGRATWFIFPEKVSHPHVFDAAYSYRERIRFGGRRMRVSEMLRHIRDAGAEIGLHPSIHAARDGAAMRAERLQVEEAVQCGVRSVRQHFLRWDADVTPHEQRKAGLNVDSSLGFNCGAGFRAGTAFPFRILIPDASPTESMVEVPLQLMDVALFSGDGLNCRSAEEALAVCVGILDEVQAVGGVLVANWHPNVISDERFMMVIRTLLAEVKRRRPWFATISEVAEHWERKTQNFSGS